MRSFLGPWCRAPRFWAPLALLALLASCAPAARSQEFVAISPEEAPSYRIDFARHWYATRTDEQRERAELEAALHELEGLAGSLTESAATLQRALELHDDVQILFNRLYSYAYLRYAVDTENRAALTESVDLDREVSTRTAFLRSEVSRIGSERLAELEAEAPSLERHAFEIEQLERNAPHILAPAEEALLSATEPLATGWQAELYDRLRNREVKPEPGDSGASPEAAARAAFQRHRASVEQNRELYAFALLRLATARDQVARRRGFPDAASAAYFPSYWTRAEVDRLVEQIAQHADLYKRYERARVAHLETVSGRSGIGVWDLAAQPTAAPEPRFTIGEATAAIEAAMEPFGEEYGRELAALLDPTSGRLDIVPGGHRRRGGFSRGFIGTDSVFFSAGFQGSYNDLRVLAHEAAHAVHRQLMNRNDVLPAYAVGPSYLFEAFAIFNELLLPDALAEHAASPELRQYYLERFLAGKGLEMFVVAPEVALEHAVYDGVADGSLQGAEGLDVLADRIYSRFSIWQEVQPELRSRWADVVLMYEDPFYDVNYVYGSLVALAFYDLYRRDPAAFLPRYLALMKHGFDAPPADLLERFLDLDLQDPQLVERAVRLLADKVTHLEESYATATR